LGKNKLRKFSELASFSNVYQNHNRQTDDVFSMDNQQITLKGKWSEIFDNDNPICLELACGKGEYTLGMAKMYPNRNFIGVDIKGNRIHVGAKRALEENLKNVRFLRTQIEKLESFFLPEEFNEIWITFPDPFLREGKAKKRLTSPQFISRYKRLLPEDHSINLKTDSPELYEYTLEVIENENLKLLENIPDVYALSDRDDRLDIKTYYEKMHLSNSRTIRFLKFKL